MSALLPFLVLDQPCEQVQEDVKRQLTEAGYRIVQTFDLHVARLAHPDCPCPHHGTNDCTCQLVVLLVYQNNEDPATLVIHGQDGKTWLSLATPTGQRSNQHLGMMVRRTLTPRSSHVLSSTEAACDAHCSL
jgi:hypothetical protein